ncbi:MAG: hypothetical protein WCQ54_01110 [Clostridiaceae bacterium]
MGLSLATSIKSTNYGGVVTCCGNMFSHEVSLEELNEKIYNILDKIKRNT